MPRIPIYTADVPIDDLVPEHDLLVALVEAMRSRGEEIPVEWEEALDDWEMNTDWLDQGR
jgi:hypothetical protein